VSILREALFWMLVACASYLVLVTLLYLFQLPFAFAENERLNRERAQRARLGPHRSPEAFPPVSIVIAAYNEASTIVSAVQACLAQRYPRLEVVVVNDGSVDETLATLRSFFDLAPTGRFHVPTLPTKQVRAVYTSVIDPRLKVVDKVNAGKADALNCGVNFARFPWVCGVDADTVLADDALPRSIEALLGDPDALGLTSYLSITLTPERARFVRGEKLVDRSILSNFQHLDYVRAFHNSRLAWSRFNYMLCTVGAFQLWRRDILVEVGGFSGDFTCEDIELTFRVHERCRRAGRPYRVLSLPDEVGATEGPTSVSSLIAQRARWQRVILETFLHYRRMLVNRRYGTVGLLGMPFYLLSEVLAPLFEQLALLMLPLALVAHRLDWRTCLLVVGLIAVANGVLTTAALLIADRNERTYRKRDLARLTCLAPLDFIVYRPILMWARLKGTLDFLRGDRSWHKFERNPRHLPATSD